MFDTGQIETGPGGELALSGADTAAPASRGLSPGRFLRLSGRIAYGRAYGPLTGLMAEAAARRRVSDSSRQDAMIRKAQRHARTALRHAATARATLLAVVVFCMLVGLVVLAHETRNTEQVYLNHIVDPTTARSPRQSWGYTPVLYELPLGIKARLIAFDQAVEARFKALGLGRSKSGSSSVSSIKLSAAIMSLFGLIPLVQFGLGQHARSVRRRAKADRAMVVVRAR